MSGTSEINEAGVGQNANIKPEAATAVVGILDGSTTDGLPNGTGQ